MDTKRASKNEGWEDSEETPWLFKLGVVEEI